MNENIDPELIASEEVDVEPFEGMPDFDPDTPPWKNTDHVGGQDDGELDFYEYTGGPDA